MVTKMNASELTEFLKAEFPQVADDYIIEDVSLESVTVRLKTSDKHLRPGGTISGPSMFALVDTSMYLVILANIGPKALTVTTNCSIDFMRKPAADTDLIAKARIHKLGRVLVVGDVMVNSAGNDKLVARASLTYSIPPAPVDNAT